MKKIEFSSCLMSLALVLCVSPSVRASGAKPKLPSLEAKIYQGIVDSQLRQTGVPRSAGAWTIYSKFRGRYFGAEANSFMVAKELLALSEVSSSFELPGYARVARAADANLRMYLLDARETHEPLGTLAYFPILDHATGRRGVVNALASMVPAFNVPDDFDSSSQAFLWFARTQQQEKYQQAFVSTVADYRDLNRTTQHLNDNLWKSPNSGAFMTWAERDNPFPFGNRIFQGINDVDCVVDLNVLTALATYQQSHALPKNTEEGAEASCRLAVYAATRGFVPQCGVYYDRPSEFWISFANARLAGASCLEPAVSSVEKSLLKRARILARPSTRVNNATEVAEILVSIKKLYPVPENRPAAVKALLPRLENRLRTLFAVKASGAAEPRTEDSLFIVRGLSDVLRLDWYSPAYTSALSLLALTLP